MHNDQPLDSFLTKNTPVVLDMVTNGIVYEPLARSDDYVAKLERLSSCLWLASYSISCRLDSDFMSACCNFKFVSIPPSFSVASAMHYASL